MPVVVTGAAGFIGGMLATALAADGERVVAVDRRPVPVRYPGVIALRADLLDRDSAVESALREADVVYHLAGRPGVRDEDPEADKHRHRDNVLATAHVLSAVPLRTPLVVASSSSVYGSSTGRPSQEEDAPNPLGGYARSKLAVEWLCAQRAAAGGAVTVARPFTVAGEGQRPDMAISRWIEALRAGRPLRVFGSPWRLRDITDVRDVVRSLRAIVERGVVGCLNVGTGSPRTLAELAIAVCRAVGAPSEFMIVSAGAEEPAATHADTGRHERLLGFRPITDLDTLVRRQVAACLAHERATLAEETTTIRGTLRDGRAGGGTGPTRMVERMLEARLVETRMVEVPFDLPEAGVARVSILDAEEFPGWTRDLLGRAADPAGSPADGAVDEIVDKTLNRLHKTLDELADTMGAAASDGSTNHSTDDIADGRVDDTTHDSTGHGVDGASEDTAGAPDDDHRLAHAHADADADADSDTDTGGDTGGPAGRRTEHSLDRVHDLDLLGDHDAGDHGDHGDLEPERDGPRSTDSGGAFDGEREQIHGLDTVRDTVRDTAGEHADTERHGWPGLCHEPPARGGGGQAFTPEAVEGLETYPLSSGPALRRGDEETYADHPPRACPPALGPLETVSLDTYTETTASFARPTAGELETYPQESCVVAGFPPETAEPGVPGGATPADGAPGGTADDQGDGGGAAAASVAPTVTAYAMP